jgi:hypothetical protein
MAGSARGQPELTSAYRRTGLTSREVWFRHLALGGNADEVSVEAQLYGLLALPSGEYDVLAQAVDEALDDLPRTVTRRPGARVGGLGRVGVVLVDAELSDPAWNAAAENLAIREHEARGNHVLRRQVVGGAESHETMELDAVNPRTCADLAALVSPVTTGSRTPRLRWASTPARA